MSLYRVAVLPVRRRRRWPFDLDPADPAGLAAFRHRLGDFMEKAVREAKFRTTWIAPHEAYEQAVRNFVELALDPARSGEFLGDFTAVIKPLMVAGALTSLTQTLVKLAAPGIPDIYQGSEGFDLSFVDPDNRRPIDFESRAEMVEFIGITELGGMTEGWKNGARKLHLLRCGLALRHRARAPDGRGRVSAAHRRGPEQESVVAFAGTAGEDWAIAVAPCRTLRLTAGNDRPVVPRSRWHDTAAVLPTPTGARFVNRLTGETRGTDGRVRSPACSTDFPWHWSRRSRPDQRSALTARPGVKQAILDRLKLGLGILPENAKPEDWFSATSQVVREVLMQRWHEQAASPGANGSSMSPICRWSS